MFVLEYNCSIHDARFYVQLLVVYSVNGAYVVDLAAHFLHRDIVHFYYEIYPLMHSNFVYTSSYELDIRLQ